MKIEDKAKRHMYHNYICRNGYGRRRQYATPDTRAIEQMKQKPYGGIYGDRKMDA